MVRHLGTLGRITCLVTGVMILGLFGALPSPWRYLTLVGLIPLGVALGGHCPVRTLAGGKERTP